MRQILVTTERLPEETLKELREAGVIPIYASDVKAVRLICAEPPLIGADAITKSAMKAIAAYVEANSSSGGSLRNTFVNSICEYVLDAAAQAERNQ